MKKLSASFRHWLAVRSKREIERRSAQISGRHAPVYGVVSENGRRYVARISKKDELPPTLCLDTDIPGAIEYFNNLRARTIMRRRAAPRPRSKRTGRVRWIKSYTDFKTLKMVSPGAALILAAEYDRIQRTRTFAPTAIDLHRWDAQVYRRLYELGFFGLLGFDMAAVSRVLPHPEKGATEYLTPMFCGNDTDLSEPADVLLDLFTAVGGDDASRVQLLGAVADAIENVKGHAYDGMRHPGIPRLWWMSGSADRAARRLTLSIYDQGVTIPVTLPNNWSKDILSSVLRSLLRSGEAIDILDPRMDGHAVAAAMRLTKTSSGLDERGKGLAKIRSAVSDCAGGRLRVISRRGNYLFENGVETVDTLSTPLNGTYIGIEATFGEGGGNE